MIERIKNLFTKKTRKTKEEDKPSKKFMEVSNLDEFKEMYIKFHKQELALENNFSYFDVSASNMDGTFFGEMFDNAVRIKFLAVNNKEFLEQVDEEELMKQVREEVAADLKQYREAHPQYNEKEDE